MDGIFWSVLVLFSHLTETHCDVYHLQPGVLYANVPAPDPQQLGGRAT